MAERGLLDGVSSKILKSNFASGLTPSMMKEIQVRSKKPHVPVEQYWKNVAHLEKFGGIANAYSSFNQGTIRFHHDQQVQGSVYLNSKLGRGQLSNGMYSGLMHQNHQALNGNSLNQVRLGQSCFGSHIGANNMHQNFPENYGNNLYNAGPSSPSYGMVHGFMTSASGLTGSLNQNNNGSLLENQSFQYGLGNGNMASSSNSSNDPWNNSTSSNNSYGIQLNDGPQMFDGGVGIMSSHANNNNNSGLVHNRITNPNILASNLGHNNNNFGFVNETQNANTHFAPLGHTNNSFGFVNGTRTANTNAPPLAHYNYESFRSDIENQNANMHAGMATLGHGNSVFAARNESVSELPESLIRNANQPENISSIPILPQHQSGHLNGNAASSEHQYSGSSSTNDEARRMEDDISELFLMVENMELLNEVEETLHANECLNSDFSSSSSQVFQPSQQPQTISHVIDPLIESDVNKQKSLSSNAKNFNHEDNAGYVDWEFFDRFWMDR